MSRKLLYQITAVTLLPLAAPQVFADSWFQTWSTPPRDQSFEVVSDTVDFAVPGAILNGWQQPLSEPVRQKRGLGANEQQALASPPFVEQTLSSKWHEPLSEPVRLKSKLYIQQSTTTNVFVVSEVITEDKWHQPWSLPTRAKPRTDQQALAWIPVIAAPDTNSADKWFQPWTLPVRDKSFEVVSDVATFGVPDNGLNGWQYPWSEPVRKKPGLGAQHQQASWLVEAAPFAETVTESRWHQPWSEPTKRKPSISNRPFMSWGHFTPQAATVTEDQWHQPWTLPMPRKRGLAASEQQFTTHFGIQNFYPFADASSGPIFTRITFYQSQAFPLPIVTPETITADKWLYPWSQPVREGSFDVVSTVTTFGVPDNGITGWYQPLNEPIRHKFSPCLQQSYTANIFFIAETITEDKWHFSWSEPVRLKLGLRISLQQTIASVPFVEDRGLYPKWGYNWSAPVRPKTGLPTTQQAAFTGPIQVVIPEVITADKWIYPWSEPVRFKLGLKTVYQQSLATVAFVESQNLYPKWGFSWSEPIRIKRGLPVTSQVAFTKSTITPETITADKWSYPWSIPVRFKAGLKPIYQQTLASIPFIEDRNLYPKWGYAWSIPVKLGKIGLKVALQQFFTTDTITPSGPTATVTLDATEVNSDIASISINVYNSRTPVASLEGAKVSVVELDSGGDDPTSIREI